MNKFKIACEYIVNNFDINYLAHKYGVSKSDVVNAIFQYMKTYPESSWYGKIERKLKIDIAKSFLSFSGKRDKFLEIYGMTRRFFFKFMYDIIEDYDIIPSETLADKLYVKLLDGDLIISTYVPKRIIKRIAWRYVNHMPDTQTAVALFYNTTRGTIASILRRGIAENIVDDVTAEQIYVRVTSNLRGHKSYEEAFDKRALLQESQSA